MTLALPLLIALLQPASDPLVVPAPPSAPLLADVVWPALRAQPARGGWSPTPSERTLRDPAKLARRAGAQGVLWAVVDDDVVLLRLFRAADGRFLEVEVGPVGGDAAALAESTRLQAAFLLGAPRQGGRKWRVQPSVPRLPPIDPALARELEPPPVVLPPERARPVIPQLAAPGEANGHTSVRVERLADPPPRARPWRVAAWAHGGPWFAPENVGFAVGGEVALPLAEWFSARLGADLAPPSDLAGITLHILSARAGLGYRLWEASTDGTLLGGLRYDRVGGDASAQRAAAYLGFGLDVLPHSALSVGLDAVVGGSPWSVAVAGADPLGAVDALLRLRVGYRSLR